MSTKDSTARKRNKNNARAHRPDDVSRLKPQRPAYVRPSLREKEGPPPLTLAQAPGTLQQVGREADMAWAGVKRIMSLLNVENKHVYYNASGQNVTQAGSVLDLCSLISQGVGGAQRVGDSLKILRIRVKAQVTVASGGSSRQAVTLVLGHSKDGVPAVADVFAVVSSSTSGLAYPADTYQQADKWSQHHTIPLAYQSATGAVSGGNFSALVEFNQKFGHDVLYTNASTTTASGNCWFAFISNEPTTYPVLDIAVDIEFVDN